LDDAARAVEASSSLRDALGPVPYESFTHVTTPGPIFSSPNTSTPPSESSSQKVIIGNDLRQLLKLGLFGWHSVVESSIENVHDEVVERGPWTLTSALCQRALETSLVKFRTPVDGVVSVVESGQ
jgi:hypothetical protein